MGAVGDNFDIDRRAKKMITMTKRYYMGSMSLRHGNPPLKLYSQAIAEAGDYLRDHPDCEERYIVQVVAVVKRESRPITIETVRETEVEV